MVSKMKLEKVVFVKKKTLLEELVERHSTVSHTKFFLESRGESFENYKEQDEVYKKALFEVRRSLPTNVNQAMIDKSQLSNFKPDGKSLIVPIGDPGLIINCAKYMESQPILALNPDYKRYSDVFTSTSINKFADLVNKCFNGDAKITQITMAQASLDDGQTLYAVNDLFIGRKTHVSARYNIRFANNEENQISSGIIVSTGAGSTGWISSIYGTANRISKLSRLESIQFDWEENKLLFAVREAFESKISSMNLLRGEVVGNKKLEITSQMPNDGVIFSDGIEEDYLPFPAGSKLTVSIANKKFNLIRGEEK